MQQQTVLHHNTKPATLTDDPSVTEIYADEFAGLSFNNGNANLTFSVTRADHTQNPAPQVRKVVSRLVLPAAVLVNMHAVLGQVIKEFETKGIIKKAPTLNIVQ